MNWQLLTRRVSGWLRLAIVFTAPLLLGSVHSKVVIAESLICTLMLLMTLIPAHKTSGWDRMYKVPYLVIVLTVISCATLLQLLPPRIGDLRPISLDPPATVVEAIRLLGLTSLVLTQVLVVRREGVGAIRRTLWAVASSGAISFVLFIAQWSTDATALLWFYVPEDGMPKNLFRATFVNDGQQAMLMGMAAIASSVLALDARRPAWKPLAGLFLVICTIGLFLCRNVVAWNATGFASLLLVAAVASAKRKQGKMTYLASVLAIVLLVGLGNIVDLSHFGLEQAPSGKPGWSRTELLRDVSKMVRENAWTGVGAGAFYSAFPAYNRSSAALSFRHAECVPLEMLAEYGLICGLGLLIALFIAFISAVRRSVTIPAGAVMAIVALAISTFFMASTAANGIAIPAAALLGCVASEVVESKSGRHSGFDEVHGTRISRLKLFLVAGFVLVLQSLLASSPYGPDLETDITYITRGDVTYIASAIERHPGSYRIPLLGAELAMAKGDLETASELISKTVSLAPYVPSVKTNHLRFLLLRGRYSEAQALWEELRQEGLHTSAFGVLLKDSRIHKKLVFLIPASDQAREVTLELLSFLESRGRNDLIRLLLERAVEAMPQDLTFRARLCKIKIENGELEEAEKTATAILAANPQAPEGYYLMGMLFYRKGQYFLAYHAYLEAALLVLEDPDPWFMAAEAILAAGDTVEFNSIVPRIEALARDPDLRYRLLRLQSRAAEIEGSLKNAADRLIEAEQIRPWNRDDLLHLADIYERMGDHQGAILALRRLLSRYPDDGVARARLERLSPSTKAEDKENQTKRKKVW